MFYNRFRLVLYTTHGVCLASHTDISSKEEAGTKTAKLREEKELLDRQQHADLDAEKNLQENLEQLTNREQELMSQEEQMQTRLKKINDTLKKHKEELSRNTKELNGMREKHQASRLVHKIALFLFFVGI